MFERYAPSSRRAIFFAREAALHDSESDINSHFLLLGLLREPNRANTLFRLSELLPDEAQRQAALPKYPEPRDLALAKDAKRILAYAAEEANRLENYWIDAEHLVLGILRESHSSACKMLNELGVTLAQARRLIADSPGSYEDLGPVPDSWQLGLRRPERRWRTSLIVAVVFGALIGIFVVQYYLSH